MTGAKPAEPFSLQVAVRWSQILLLASVGSLFTLVVLNNTTDFGSNYQFVRHVLSMDTTFPGNHLKWRAITAPSMHLIFYIVIICWEALSMVLCWIGCIHLFRARAKSAAVYNKAKRAGVVGLTTGMMLWLFAFIIVGGEWFVMWQSPIWNGQEAAFRTFTVEALILGLLLLPEPDAQAPGSVIS
jgi:predicted small integral membrane protein